MEQGCICFPATTYTSENGKIIKCLDKEDIYLDRARSMLEHLRAELKMAMESLSILMEESMKVIGIKIKNLAWVSWHFPIKSSFLDNLIQIKVKFKESLWGRTKIKMLFGNKMLF